MIQLTATTTNCCSKFSPPLGPLSAFRSLRWVVGRRPCHRAVAIQVAMAPATCPRGRSGCSLPTPRGPYPTTKCPGRAAGTQSWYVDTKEMRTTIAISTQARKKERKKERERDRQTERKRASKQLLFKKNNSPCNPFKPPHPPTHPTRQVGSEAEGLSDAVRRAAEEPKDNDGGTSGSSSSRVRLVSIPLAPGKAQIESLNAAVAGSVILCEAHRQISTATAI
jgi:hypothetical protein